ncbi:hypothetical protein FJ251_05040 [bacterium]|nr:hypothetical protein [bacterium]
MRLLRPMLGLALLALACLPTLAAGALLATPSAQTQPLAALESVELYRAPVVDAALARLEDEDREAEGLPPRFAIPFPVELSPASAGTWETIPGGNQVWRLRVASPGALSLNLGFTRFALPEAAQLIVYAADFSDGTRAFTAADNAAHGELWTPVVMGDALVIELTVPVKAADRVELMLGSVNVGYRGFGELLGRDRSGACNVDVVCPEGDDWRSEIPAIGVISTGGSTFCTGFMVNNTAQDARPYFMTANHCGINTGNAASLVVYWNFESPTCGQHGGGSLAQNQTGSFFRASYSASDFTLVELDELPNPAWGVTYAGWDKSSADPASAVAIHHPSTDEKSISFEYDPTSTTSYLGTAIPGDGTHIRITDWDLGTTEPGSSGSPLFSPNHHVVGQLHGGYASCSSQTSDWYGRFSVSWTHGLSSYLDPLNTGAVTLDTYDPYATGMQVTPGTGLAASGDQGGPFSPASQVYTIENAGETAFSFQVTDDAAWVSIAGGSGALNPGATAQVTVSINSAANGLPQGLHSATVQFTNTTNHHDEPRRGHDPSREPPGRRAHAPVQREHGHEPGLDHPGSVGLGRSNRPGWLRPRLRRSQQRIHGHERLWLQPERRLHEQHARVPSHQHALRLLRVQRDAGEVPPLAQRRAAGLRPRLPARGQARTARAGRRSGPTAARSPTTAGSTSTTTSPPSPMVNQRSTCAGRWGRRTAAGSTAAGTSMTWKSGA